MHYVLGIPQDCLLYVYHPWDPICLPLLYIGLQVELYEQSCNKSTMSGEKRNWRSLLPRRTIYKARDTNKQTRDLLASQASFVDIKDKFCLLIRL